MQESNRLLGQADWHPHCPEPQPSWDVGALSEALGATPDIATDVAHGTGVGWWLGPDHTTHLEAFPQSGVVRITGQDLQLALFRQNRPPVIEPSGNVVFEIQAEPAGRWLSVSPRGEATLFYDPQATTTRAETAPTGSAAPERPDIPLSPENVPTDHPEPQDATLQTSLPEPRQTKQPRVSYSGRLGTDPRCRTTPREVLVCSFPVAERQEGFDKPKWRNTVTFKALAQRVKETMKKGDMVDVIGYEHPKTRKGKDGKTRHETEIYAVVVNQR